MKRKLLFLPCMLLGMLINVQNAKADEDLTSRITNADFSSTEGWTADVSNGHRDLGNGLIGTYKVQADHAAATVDATHLATEYCFGFQARWSDGYASYYQQISDLPAGVYTLSYDIENTKSGSTNSTDYQSLFYVDVNNTRFYDSKTEWWTGKSGWTSHSIVFEIGQTSNAKISLGYDPRALNKPHTQTPGLYVSHLALSYRNYTSGLKSVIDCATLLSARVTQDDPSAAATLNGAISTAQGVLDGADNTTSYQSTINSAISTLRGAMSTAKSAITLLSGEDITFMIENAGFESSTPVSSGIVTTMADACKNGTGLGRMQTVCGWQYAGGNSDNHAAGVFAYGEDPWLGGTDYKVPATNPDGEAEGQVLGIVAVWTNTTQYTQNVTLPAGRYVITLPIYNKVGGTTNFSKNLFGFVENGGTEHLATAKTYAVNSWTTETVSFDLNAETSGYISLGYTAVGEGSGKMPHLFVDGLTITYTDAENAYAATVASATATYNSATYAGVTGTERTALYNALNLSPAPSTVEEYFTAIDNINDAVSTFTSAKENYDEYAEAVTIASTIGATGVTVPTTASEALTRAHELNVNINTKVNSTYTYDVTSIYVGGWSRSNLNDNAKGQHWSGDGNKTYMDKSGSGSSSASQTIHLPAGEYILKVAGRGQADATTITMSAAGNSVTFRSKGDSGVGIDMTGAANFASADDTYCNDNKGRGWEWRFIPLSLDAATDITVTLNIARTSGSWASFSDFTILMSSTDADTDDYTALNSAISNAESHIIGFEDGEYAPYNNVNALTKLALAKRINQEETNPKGAVTAATAELAAINVSGWSSNSGELNAFYKGDFDGYAEDTTTPLDYTPNGWTATDNFRMMIKNVEDYPGLADASAGTAAMSWGGGITYGETAGYTMPLKANTVYRLQFKAAGWNNETRSGMSVSILNSTDGMALYNLGTPDRDIKGNATNTAGMTSYDVVFATGAAGNYIFHIQSGHNMVVTDFSITKAASQVLEFSDNSAVPTYAPGTYPSVKITRNLTAGRWATAVYPFAVSGVDNIAVLNSYDSSTGALGFTSATESTANEPFFMKSNTDKSEISLSNVEVAAIVANPVATKSEASLKGAYTATDITDEDKNYVLSNNQIFSVGDAGATINPYRAYIQIAANDPSVKVLSFIVDGTATGVEAPEVTEAEEEEILYNTAGVRVGKDYKGIVINQKGEKRLQK